MDHLDYTQYFNLEDHPFRLLPDPTFFFPSEPHIRAKEVLLYGITRGEGFMVLTGEAGTGKSLLLRMLLSELPNEKETAMIVAPKVSPTGLMKLILEDLGIHYSDTSEIATLQKRIEKSIIELAERGKDLLVVIDEAQNLPLDTLEQLRLLSNIETSKKKLLQILLVGQPELISLINSPTLGQLAQRISIMESLRPLNPMELEDYITFRINKVGGAGLHIEKKALKTLHKASYGIPRLINKIMDRSLLVAASVGTKKITNKMVEEAIETLPDVDFPSLSSSSLKKTSPLKTTKWYISGLLVALLLFSLKFLDLGVFAPTSQKISIFTQHNSVKDDTAPSQKHSQQNHVKFGVVRIKRAYVREGPGKQYPRFTTVSMGDRLIIRGQDGAWFKVKVYDSRGNEKNGWIRRDLLIIEK